MAFALSSFAQNEVMVSQYMFNGLFINPAYSGSHKFWEATALHRSQWVGLEGAPTSQLLEIDGPLSNNKIGLGAIIMHDDIGDTEQFEFSANASYHLDLDADQNNRLSFGIRAGVSSFTARLDQTDIVDENDPVFLNGALKNQMIPKFGIGAYYYNSTTYAGISIPTLFAADDKLQFQDVTSGTDDVHFENHVFVTGGKFFKVSESLGLKPNVLVKYHPAAPVEVDLNVNALLNEIIWFGVSYRTGDAIIGMLEVMPSSRLRIGYAYDFTLTDIANYSSGSHEVMLGYAFGEEVIKMKSPRLF
jgi:type IX secretion system PorP/SprF family membrane protein